jgi:SOS-response transcriptional repressor LexA
MPHWIQARLLELAREIDLGTLTLRQTADRVGEGISPQRLRHHLLQLHRRGLISIDRSRRSVRPAPNVATRAFGPGGAASGLFSIPVLGAANCGSPNLFADENLQGFLKVSARLLGRSKPTGLFALKADGNSMNRANIDGKSLQDGDFAIVDSNRRSARTNDIVVAIIDGRATVKRFIDDKANGQIVLKADSSYDFEPIHLHVDDDFQISGTVVAVIKQPRIS